jgi:hypothetical protein
MIGGVISDNDGLDFGGGLHNDSYGTFKMLGGEITGNAAPEGADIYQKGVSDWLSIGVIHTIIMGMVVVVVGVVAGGLFFYFRKRNTRVEVKMS